MEYATSLVGTRSPWGAVSNTFNPDYVSGGSGSGSASVLALALATWGISLLLPYNRIAVILFVIGVLTLTWLLRNKTRLGMNVRAVRQNRAMADCCGVPTGCCKSAWANYAASSTLTAPEKPR